MSKKCSFVGLKEHYDQLLSRDGNDEPIGLKGSDLVDCWILADVTYGWLERKFNEAAHVTKKSVIDTYQMAFLGYENLLHKVSSIYEKSKEKPQSCSATNMFVTDSGCPETSALPMDLRVLHRSERVQRWVYFV